MTCAQKVSRLQLIKRRHGVLLRRQAAAERAAMDATIEKLNDVLSGD